MEQILKNFFNDNSVCVGLCDLKRKVDDIKINYTQQAQYQQPKVQSQMQFTQPKQQSQVQAQPKPQRQSLAQIFAAQQQAYAAQQAYLAQQRQKYAAQTQQQAQQQQRVVQQKPVYTEAKPLFANQNTNSYIQQMPQKKPQTTVIVNGNMKKVISPAVPPARY